MEEVWKNVVGYDGIYQVSNTGRIKRILKSKERMLIGRLDKDGYKEVILSKKQNKKYCKLHRLVAEAFVPNTNNKPQVNHKDRNKTNNSADNLEWVTGSENTIHSFVTGRKPHKGTRAVSQFTKDMKLISHWESIGDASRALNVSRNNICSCCRGHLGTAGGYIWKYKEVI